MKNRDVVRKFINKEQGYGSNLYSFGDRLFSYNTCIAQWYNDALIINTTKYSSSTSRHQSYLNYAISYKSPQVRFVNNVEINSQNLWQIM